MAKKETKRTKLTKITMIGVIPEIFLNFNLSPEDGEEDCQYEAYENAGSQREIKREPLFFYVDISW